MCKHKAVVTPRPAASLPAGLARLEQSLLVFFCAALAALMVVQIVLRYVFLAPFLGIEEVAVLLGLWIYFLALVHVTRTDQHIASGVVQLVVKNPRALRALALFRLVVCACSSAVFTGYALRYAVTTWQSGRTSTYLSWPTTLWVAAMLVGFAASTAIFCLYLWRLWRGGDATVPTSGPPRH